MPLYTFRLRGTGRAEVIAAGLLDAEAAIQKELSRAFPEGTVDVREIRRCDDVARLVDRFDVSYRIVAEVAAEAATRTLARRLAFSQARDRLRGTLFERVRWEGPEAPSG